MTPSSCCDICKRIEISPLTFVLTIMQTQRNRLDSRMMKKVTQALRDADAILAIVDCSSDPQETLQSFKVLFDTKRARGLPLALVGGADSLCPSLPGS